MVRRAQSIKVAHILQVARRTSPHHGSRAGREVSDLVGPNILLASPVTKVTGAKLVI